MEVELCYYKTTFKGNLKKRVDMELFRTNCVLLIFPIGLTLSYCKTD